MKAKRFLLILLTGILISGFTSCDNKADPPFPAAESEVPTRLGEILAGIFQSDNLKEDSYVLYDSETKEFMVLAADDYAVCQAFAKIVVRESPSKKPPHGTGWKYAGSGKTKWAALKLAERIAREIPVDRDFEVHVERGDDGVFRVWYRVL